MKRKVIVAVSAFCLLFAAAAHAENAAGQFSAEIYGGAGVGAPTGSYPGASSNADTVFNFGALCGYTVIDNLALIGGVEYASKPMVLKYSLDSEKDTFKLHYYDFLLGARYFATDGFYFEGGLFYGLKAGDQKAKWSGDSGSGEIKISDIEGAENNNDFGFFLGLGYVAKISQHFALDFGCRLESGLVNVYKNADTKIRTNDIVLNAGAQYIF